LGAGLTANAESSN